MKFKKRTINELADMICGNSELGVPSYFKYRSSSYLTEFFQDCDLPYVHDGSTRRWWVAGVLEEILAGPASVQHLLPDGFVVVIRELMNKRNGTEGDPERTNALAQLNASLATEGFTAFYDEDGICQVQNLKTKATSASVAAPQRAWTKDELKSRDSISNYLDTASEDAIIEQVLLPLFRQLGFQRITSAGHKDKALEYGKDIWMKFRLPTMHTLYFGVQVKRGKIDAAGQTKNSNVAEILAQIRMMLGHMVLTRRSTSEHLSIMQSLWPEAK